MIRKIPVGYFQSSTADPKVDETNRTVELIFSTGYKGLRRDIYGNRFMESVSMDPKHVNITRLQSGSAPLLAAHSSTSLDDVIGVVESARIENGIGIAKVRFATDTISEGIYQKVKTGILKNVSIGYDVRKYKDITEKGDDIPTYQAVDYEIFEISIVPIGFDAYSQIRTQTNTTFTEVEIESASQRKNMLDKKENNTETQTESRKEKDRQKQIRHLVRTANLDSSVADELCDSDSTIEQVRSIVLDKVMAKQTPAPMASGYSRVDVVSTPQARMKDSLIESIAQRIDKTVNPKNENREFAGKSLVRNIETYLGRHLGETDFGLVTRAMSTSDFPLILSSSAEKAAQNRYQLTPRSFEKWISRDTLRNYKEATRVRGGDHANLVERPEGAEFKYGSFGEEVEYVTLKDFGIVLAMTSKAVVNDDLSMLRAIANEGGASASRKENALVYEALTNNTRTMGDGVVLYHGDHANLGTAGAISETTFTEAFKMMRKQTSVDGLEILNIPPRWLIVGPDQEVAAMKFLATVSPAQSSDVNPFSGKLELIVEGSLTGNQYYFAADSALIPTVVLYTMEGQQGPSINSRMKWETNSLEMRVEHTAIAHPADFRGLLKNAGQ